MYYTSILDIYPLKHIVFSTLYLIKFLTLHIINKPFQGVYLLLICNIITHLFHVTLLLSLLFFNASLPITNCVESAFHIKLN